MASLSHIKPGEKGKITAKVDIKRIKGLVFKTVQVFSNDPKKPMVTLSLKAIIK
jgi:hypothetical protein